MAVARRCARLFGRVSQGAWGGRVTAPPARSKSPEDRMFHAEEAARKPCAVVDVEIDEASHGRCHSRIPDGRQAPDALRRNNRITDARDGQVCCAALSATQIQRRSPLGPQERGVAPGPAPRRPEDECAGLSVGGRRWLSAAGRFAASSLARTREAASVWPHAARTRRFECGNRNCIIPTQDRPLEAANQGRSGSPTVRAGLTADTQLRAPPRLLRLTQAALPAWGGQP